MKSYLRCALTCLRYALLVTGVLLVAGCSKETPEKQMLGLWMGAPNVREEADKAVDAAAQGKEVPSIVRGLAKMGAQFVANKTMAVEIDFKVGGTVFFRGNTELLDLPKDSDGTWSVKGDNLDQFDITFGTAAKQLHGKVLFRNKDEFSLKLDDASIAAITPPKPKEEPKEAPKDSEKDKPKNGEKDASKSGPKETKKEAPKAPEFDLSSIIFKRNTE